ncbi:hypothetical protein B9Z65_4611 [Elsinoe australis]|uniref:DUF7029 domain-containing protein n=1 Tax=Elsinoe australis TaxID=40998 RepID=A0A2P8A5I3_9PEZI|nr:hypothetical protein B9Z65_4611 [Elsinoe australis]
MYYPAIDIATTSLLQSYTCSDSTLTLQLSSSRKEAIRKILAWPKQNIVLITQDAACNKPEERGVFLTESSSASIEGGITKIAFNVKTSKWSDVAEKMDISYGTRTGNEGTPSDLQPSCASTYQHSGTAPTTSPNVASTYQNLSPRAKALVDYAVGKLRYAANGNILVAPTNFTQPAIKSAPWTPNDKAAQDDLEAKLLSAGLDDPASFKKAADAAISGTCPVTSVTKQTQTVLRTSQGLRKRFEFGDLVDVACDTFAGDIFGTAGDAACAGKDLYDNQDAWACLFTGCFKSQYDPPTYQFDFEASWFASYRFPQNTEVVTFSDGSKINCIDCSLDISEIKLAGHISVILATNKVVEANIAVSEKSKASMVLNLNAVQSLNYQWKTAVTSLPMDPLTVSGFFSIEPTVIFSLGAEVSTTAAVNIEVGARMEWEEASASLDLTNRAVSDIKGWQPKLDVTFPTFSLRGGVKVYPFIRRLYEIKFSILGSELSDTATFTSQTAIGFDAETLDESKGLCSMDDMRLLSYVSNKQNVVFGNRAIQTLNERSVAQPEKCYKVPSNKPTAEEIQTLRSVGQEFCTSYIAYDPPVVGVYTTGIISTVTTTEERTTVEIQTSPTVFTTYPVTIDIFRTISTVTTTTDAAAGTITLDAQYQKRGLDLPAATTAAASQDHPRAPMVTTSAASTAEPLDKRDIATPDLVATWAQSKIFFACSQVATGSTTVTFTTAYQTQYTSTATSTNTFYTMVNGGIITKRVYTTLSAWNTIPTYTSTRTLDASCPLQTQASCFNIKGAGVPRVAGRALGLANEVAQASFNAPATAFYLACDGSLISLPDHRTLSISSGLLDFVSHEATTQGSRIKCEKVTASKELKCTNPAGGDVIYVWDPESSYLNETFFQVTPLIDPRLWTPSFAAGSPSSEYHPVTLTYEPVTCPCGTPEPVTDLAMFDPKNLACPAADGYTYKTADGVLWQIQCNTNYPDNDITTATASSLVSCIESCDTDIQCIVATWVASTQLCTLKSDVPIYSSLVQSPLKTHAVVRLSKIAPPRQLLVNPTFSVGRGQWSASINNLRLDGWTATPGVSWESANQQYSVPAPIHALLNGRFGSGYRFTDVSISQTVSGLTVGKWYRFSTDVWWFSYFGSAYVSYYVDNQQLFRSNAIPERVAAEHVGVNGPYAFQATATSHTWKILYQNSCDTCTGDSTSGWVSVFSATLMGPYSSAS